MKAFFSRNGWTVLVDLAMPVCLIALAASGFVLEGTLEEEGGVAGPRVARWLEVHETFFMAFAVLVSVHLFRHGKALWSRMKNLLAPPRVNDPGGQGQ